MELLTLIVLVGTFVVTALVFKLPIGVSLVISSVLGALTAGAGLPLRHFVEGSFAYFDPILIIAMAMIFMEVINESGLLGTISRLLIERFHTMPLILLLFVTLFIMFPGMLTGLSSASVLTTGAIVSPALILLGIPRVKVGALIAMAAIYGMIAPPINVPVMIIGGGVDMPYIGFELPLLFATIPLAVFSSIYFGYKYLKNIKIDEIRDKLPESFYSKYGIKLYFPLFVVIILMLGIRIFPNFFPSLGTPLIFVIGILAGLFSGRKINMIRATQKAMKNALPVMGILVGIGVFIQIMTLVGVRGYLVVNCLKLPSILLYLGIAVSMPLFGAISAYGSSSVLGIPFLLALLGQDEIIVAAALSLIASLGDLMPPTALAGIFAAQVVKVKNYFKILKVCLFIAFITALYGILMIVFANPLGKIL
ncbi:MAG: TRAP transporter large permease subunit [bacterium]|nr:TRAP transporter large permease subunit [bacterium]